jgi:hypothetical protein
VSRPPWSVRAFLAASRLVGGVASAVEAVHAGFWLGVLDARRLAQVDEAYYASAAPGTVDYTGEAHNLRGLFRWEADAVGRWFPPGCRVFVFAAGGGREMAALAALGFHADGVECHPGLVATGGRVLAGVPGAGRLLAAPRDAVPPEVAGARYDAVIVGWSSYMLVMGRDRRIALLRSLRDLVAPGAPVLLSFFTRAPGSRPHRWTARTANLLRALLGRPRVEEGDMLGPNFHHDFTEAEVRAELSAAGWAPVFHAALPTGHAVARAV